MLGDAPAIDLRDADGGLAGLPLLAPIAVAGEAEVEELVRSARAGVAMLSLRLKAVLNDVAVLERAEPQADLDAAAELARSSLERHITTRRHELADALDQARADAAFDVTAARTEAIEMVATATEETREVLLAAVGPVLAPPPNLHVVSDGPSGAAVASHPSVRNVVAPDRAGDEASHRAQPSPAAPIGPSTASPLSEPAPAVPARTTTLPVVVEAAPAPIAGAAQAARDGSGRAVSRYLYADVVLPMIAVLVVLVVLLAWVG